MQAKYSDLAQLHSDLGCVGKSFPSPRPQTLSFTGAQFHYHGSSDLNNVLRRPQWISSFVVSNRGIALGISRRMSQHCSFYLHISRLGLVGVKDGPPHCKCGGWDEWRRVEDVIDDKRWQIWANEKLGELSRIFHELRWLIWTIDHMLVNIYDETYTYITLDTTGRAGHYKILFGYEYLKANVFHFRSYFHKPPKSRSHWLELHGHILWWRSID